MHFLSLLQRETGLRKDRTTQRGRSPCFPRVLVHIHMGKAHLSGHELAAVLATACWTVEGYRTPDEAMVCRG